MHGCNRDRVANTLSRTNYVGFMSSSAVHVRVRDCVVYSCRIVQLVAFVWSHGRVLEKFMLYKGSLIDCPRYIISLPPFLPYIHKNEQKYSRTMDSCYMSSFRYVDIIFHLGNTCNSYHTTSGNGVFI